MRPDREPLSDRDRAALTELVVRMRPRLLRILARSGVRSEWDREDLVQDVLTQLVLKWRRIGDPEAWLVGALRRGVLQWKRALARRLPSLSLSLSLSLEGDSLGSTGLGPANVTARIATAQALSKLGRRARRVVVATELLGLPVSVVAQMEGTSAAAISSLKWRACQELRRILSGK